MQYLVFHRIFFECNLKALVNIVFMHSFIQQVIFWDYNMCHFFCGGGEYTILFFSFSKKNLLQWNKHNLKFIILIILSVHFSSFQCIHIVVQSSLQSISRTSSFYQTDTLYPLTTKSPFFLPPTPGSYHPAFCFSEFDYSRDCIEVYSICAISQIQCSKLHYSFILKEFNIYLWKQTCK